MSTRTTNCVSARMRPLGTGQVRPATPAGIAALRRNDVRTALKKIRKVVETHKIPPIYAAASRVNGWPAILFGTLRVEVDRDGPV